MWRTYRFGVIEEWLRIAREDEPPFLTVKKKYFLLCAVILVEIRYRYSVPIFRSDSSHNELYDGKDVHFWYGSLDMVLFLNSSLFSWEMQSGTKRINRIVIARSYCLTLLRRCLLLHYLLLLESSSICDHRRPYDISIALLKELCSLCSASWVRSDSL